MSKPKPPLLPDLITFLRTDAKWLAIPFAVAFVVIVTSMLLNPPDPLDAILHPGL